MSGADSVMRDLLAAGGLLVVGAALKFLFDRWGAQLGWSREDKRAQDGKIERVDSQARNEISRVERELKAQIGQHETDIARLDERVKHLPTADDIEEVNRRLAAVESGLSGATAKIEGQTEMVRTIRDHILRGER